METLHIIKINQSCAVGEIVVRLNGNIDGYPKTLIILGKIYKRYRWSYKTYEIYYAQVLNPVAVDRIME